MVTFKRALKNESKLRMAIAGPPGSGKTWTALLLASALAGEAGVAVIDTERGSASKYSDLYAFDVLELDSYHPTTYIEAIADAARAGYGVVVIDSLSHAWNGPGGLLEIVENAKKRDHGGNSFTAWKDATPLQNRLVDALTRAPVHIIATMRTKTEYVLEKDERGRTVPRKVGMAPIQRDGMEYEFDIFAEMQHDNTMLVQKSRCSRLAGATIPKPGADVAAILADWLRGEVAASPTPAQAGATRPPVAGAPAVPVLKPPRPTRAEETAAAAGAGYVVRDLDAQRAEEKAQKRLASDLKAHFGDQGANEIRAFVKRCLAVEAFTVEDLIALGARGDYAMTRRQLRDCIARLGELRDGAADVEAGEIPVAPAGRR